VSAVFAFALAPLPCLAFELLGAIDGFVGVVCVRKESERAEALQKLLNEAVILPGPHGQQIRSEGRGAIKAVQLAGDSCLCNQVRGVDLQAAERYQGWDADDGTVEAGTEYGAMGFLSCERASSGREGSVGQ
jgi:hypothetical protein